MKITATVVKDASIMPDIYYIWDSEIKGFGLKVIPNGMKKFLIKYRVGGGGRRASQKWFILGEASTMKIDIARKLACEMLVNVANGGDPQDEKLSRREAYTLDEFWDIFKKEYIDVGNFSVGYKRCVEYCWKIQIQPMLGDRKITEINEADVLRMHAHFSNIKHTANRARVLLHLMFKTMERWKLRPQNTNPCTYITPYKEEPRQRYLSMDEISRLFTELEQAAKRKTNAIFTVSALKLLLLTGSRKSEILKAKWEWVDWDRKVILLPTSKTGQKTIYLSDKAMEVLTELYNRNDAKLGPYIMKDKSGKKYLGDIKKAWSTICRNAKINDCRIHDLRHTAASLAISNGHSLAEIAQLLGHSTPLTTQRYAHLANNAAFNVAQTLNNLLPA